MKKYELCEDESLVRQTLLGENAAFEELVLRHERAVTGTAMKITRNVYSAKDAAQDAFLAAWMHLDSLRDASRFSSFVCAIARNCALDLCRRYACAAPDVSLDLLAYEDLDEQTKIAAERGSSAEGILLRMNRSIQVEGAFGVIKQDYAFRRFLTRGKRKTETQFLLLAFAYNVQKLWNRQNFNRFHQALFEKDTA